MGDIFRREIAAYKQTMNPQAESLPPRKSNVASQKRLLPDNGLLKTTVEPEEPKARRVAKFLILIGSEQAAKILGELDAGQVEEISREIALIKGIGGEDAGAVLSEFKSLLTGSGDQPGIYSGVSSGGTEAARRILYAAYGAEKGEALLNKAVPGSKENIFGFLEEFSPEQKVFLLKDESPSAAALVLARLPPKESAQTLAKFPAALKPEILRRIARQNDISPEVLQNVAEAIREKARHLGAGGSKDIPIDGMQTLAAILRQGDFSFGDRIIGDLENENPDIGRGLKEKWYTLDDVLSVYDRQLAEKLKSMTDRQIALLLKGRNAAFCDKIFSNVSAGRRDMIREESGILGAVSKRECDEAADDFLAWFRLAREKGNLILSTDEDWVQ